MARVKGPLMSLDASGTLAREVRFRHESGHVLVYRDGAPGSVRRRPPTASQAQVRSKFAAARARWRALTAEQRAAWQVYARDLAVGLSAWNGFLSCVLRGGECSLPSGPVLPPADSYLPPPGHLVIFPDTTWVPDHPYTPPPGSLVV